MGYTGGRIEQGENIEQTLERETNEEIGVELTKPGAFLTSVISYHDIPFGNDELAGLVLMVYEVAVADTAVITLGIEHERYEWVEPAEAAARLSNKYPAAFTDLLHSTKVEE